MDGFLGAGSKRTEEDRHVREERLATVPCDERQSRVGEHVGAVALRFGVLAVLPQDRVEVRGFGVHVGVVARSRESAD